MIGLPSLAQFDRTSTMRIWLAAHPADMRCGFDRLADLATRVAYALNQWNELSVFAGLSTALPDPAAFGAVPIDNNASEREMKRIVLNRKNSLFVGNERAGRAAAVLSGLASTCRRHGVDPQRYLTQLLVGLPATPPGDLERWLPDQWKRRDPAKPEG